MRRGHTFITVPRDQNNFDRFNKLQLRLDSLPTTKCTEHALISSVTWLMLGFDPSALECGDYIVADLYNRATECRKLSFHDLSVPQYFVFSIKILLFYLNPLARQMRKTWWVETCVLFKKLYQLLWLALTKLTVERLWTAKRREVTGRFRGQFYGYYATIHMEGLTKTITFRSPGRDTHWWVSSTRWTFRSELHSLNSCSSASRLNQGFVSTLSCLCEKLLPGHTLSLSLQFFLASYSAVNQLLTLRNAEQHIRSFWIMNTDGNCCSQF